MLNKKKTGIITLQVGSIEVEGKAAAYALGKYDDPKGAATWLLQFQKKNHHTAAAEIWQECLYGS